ncbi:UNVERIFIED_CONTAM: Outer envelope protein 80, chloroplastic [Sesamum radiatum]|uniref:Outer envelope protein 80, chloroplastic n=1 Tax=Sesamum radiatum TaxID=300843 RepID=A0AAW2W5C9_SESRA
MSGNEDARFISSSIKLPSFSPPARHHPQPHSFFSFLRLNPSGKFAKLPFNFNFQFNLGFNPPPINFITQFVSNQPIFHRNIKNDPFHTVLKKSPLFCSATLALSDSETGSASNELKSGDDSESVVQYKGDESGAVTQSKSVGSNRAAEEERVLISEVFVRNKDGEELERKDLEAEALNALKASRANSALTVREVQEDVHRIIASGYFMSCMPVAVDTRDGIRLIFQVEPNQEFQGLVCEGANVLPSKFIEDAFRDGYGKVVNIRRLDEVMSSINGWYMERGLFGMVSGVEILSGGIIKLQVSEAEVNDISIRFLDKTITSGPLAGLIGSIAIYHKNLFGRNQKLNLSLERGQIDSIFRINYTDPWIEGDDKRTSRAIMIQNSRTPGTLVHGNQPNNNGLTIGRITAGIEYSRPFRPKWNGTAGLIFQRAGAHDEKGTPIIRDFFGSPLTASGNTHDDMLLAKLETVYTFSGDPGSSMFVFNMDQGIPVSPESLVFNRVNARARQGFVIGPACFLVCLSGGHVVGKFPPHEAFPIGGTNSVRGYEEGALGSGRSYVVGSGEMSFPVNSRAPGTLVHGNQPNNNGLTIGRIIAGIEYSRPFRPKWNGTAGLIFQRTGAHDEKRIPIIRDFFGGPLTASGNNHDDMLLAKLETVYTCSGDRCSSTFVFNVDQGIPVSPEWLVFNRVNARARQGFVIGPACFLVCLSGGHVVGKFPPHEAFPIGGTNSVRGYEEGALGSGRSYVVGSGEMSFPVMGPVKGVVFADYGTDLGSGSTVPGDPAGARNKPGSGYGYGIGVRVDSLFGPLRFEYAFNDQGTGRFHFGIGL